MGFDPNEPEQRRRLRAAMKAADISPSALWLKYFSLSGDAGEYEVEAYLQGLLSLPAIQRDLLALAANELIDDLPRPHAPYSDDFGTDQPDDGSAADQPDTENVEGRGNRAEAERDNDGGSEPGTTTAGP
ncbi:hypothetical protein [Pseudarthrobacter sp. NPDC058119]|uniref:hypothetical protein n=1 Tax=Pseudarthrobacter sp. NPDC058119 TaxID=3346348 RepID=UPI0036D95136